MSIGNFLGLYMLPEASFVQINALIDDRLTPPAGLDRIDRELRQAYEALGAKDAWQMKRYETGHFETAHMRSEIMAFLKKWL